jgi:hypothetical protein
MEVDSVDKQIVIKYDVITRTVKVEENDFTTFEALGILEAVKAMITDSWLKED